MSISTKSQFLQERLYETIYYHAWFTGITYVEGTHGNGIDSNILNELQMRLKSDVYNKGMYHDVDFARTERDVIVAFNTLSNDLWKEKFGPASLC